MEKRLTFFLLRFSRCVTTSSCCSWSATGWSGRSYIREESSNVLAFESLSEKTWPVDFDFVTACFNYLAQFFSLYNDKHKLWS